MRSMWLTTFVLLCSIAGCNGNNAGPAPDPKFEELGQESVRLAIAQAEMAEKMAELEPGNPELQKLAGPLQSLKVELFKQNEKMAQLSDEQKKAWAKFQPQIKEAEERYLKANRAMNEKASGGKRQK